MKTVLFTLYFIANTSFACNLTEKDVIGGYSYKEGDNFFEFFSLEESGEFKSWLHSRPESNGKWQLINCTVTINLGFPKPIKLKFIDLTSTEAIILTDENKEPAKYKRL